ncbi:hypothetical protein B5C26_13285 [Photorhabdus luminescens]|nr:hypothetical protein B5C26_13285 [Photorhabdus luminescens]
MIDVILSGQIDCFFQKIYGWVKLFLIGKSWSSFSFRLFLPLVLFTILVIIRINHQGEIMI